MLTAEVWITDIPQPVVMVIAGGDSWSKAQNKIYQVIFLYHFQVWAWGYTFVNQLQMEARSTPFTRIKNLVCGSVTLVVWLLVGSVINWIITALG